ncbi:PLP-dependent cysteine synthase family protein [Pendulispora albinea]|uniref:Cysteine synthase family protein n=1 Tax=Pendulispora albinea TaxID=2741071 RepID=A0ABZ2LV01_9BACT
MTYEHAFEADEPAIPSIPHLLESVGHTPLVRLENLTTRSEGRLLAKLESANPGGSLKDRAAWHIIRDAEARGLLRRGATIIESSSGNFGIALAMIGAARGYRVIAIVDPKITPTNLALFAAFGAEVVVIEEKDDSGSYHKTRIAYANRLHREIPGSFRPDQCFNPLNSEAHYQSTAPELLADLGPSLSTVVCTVSTGGQLGGISRYLRRYAPHVKVVGVDVDGSTVFGGEAHGYLTPGVGLSWTPDNLDDLSAVNEVYIVSDEDAFVACRTLVRTEGLLAGVSTGAALLVAFRLAIASRPRDHVVFLASDRGERYLQTAFDERWLKEHGMSTEISLEGLRRRAARLRPLSTDPKSECANYRYELAEQLDSPTARRRPKRLG